jgi:hypothetical protein
MFLFGEGSSSISIAHALMRGIGWGSGEPPEPENEAGGSKPQLNAGSLVLQGGAAHKNSILFKKRLFYERELNTRRNVIVDKAILPSMGDPRFSLDPPKFKGHGSALSP